MHPKAVSKSLFHSYDVSNTSVSIYDDDKSRDGQVGLMNLGADYSVVFIFIYHVPHWRCG